jgi:LmbE family N-acetylglucosaminyl deacetylase
MIQHKNILVLAPHTDDETLGCGGFINKLSSDNMIHAVCFSYCGVYTLKTEFNNAIKKLDNNITSQILDFKVRYFNRQEVLDKLIEIKGQLNPDIIICPGRYDVHQDHEVVYNEAVRAFKDLTILGYCHAWNTIGLSDLRLTIDLDENNIVSKNLAMNEYKTQHHRDYFKDRSWIGNKERLEVILWRY